MDAADLLLLAFKGLAIASMPIAAIWIGRTTKHDDRLRRLAWVTAFITFDLVVFGGFTRLTDSGLGCPDWPGCYAKANPYMAAPDIRHAEASMPYGPVTMSKAWIEMIHRYLAMAVGVLILTMLAISFRRARPGAGRRPASPALASALLGLVLLQGAFGAWTVTERLQPIFVTTHLLLGLTLLAVLVWHALRLDRLSGYRTSDGSRLRQPSVRALAVVAFGALAIQVALGGWVSANYAVLACNDFPTCQGVWVPLMDFANGFHPWRELGKTSDGGTLSLAGLTAIHWAHRVFAVTAFALLGALAWRCRRIDGLARASRVLAVLLVCQGLTGLLNVVLSWPLVVAVFHNAGAAGLVATLVVINYGLPRTDRSPRFTAGELPVDRHPPVSRVGRAAG